jgi:formylglycine-generating enzyme required for sulfatase activity/DNA-binding winged helix-turn-helix (wHTH) protein/TolB-like protein/Flp pilus assembly protein TadD
MPYAHKEIYEFEGFRLDVSERILRGPNGEKITLPDKVFETLCVLIRNCGTLVKKDELLEAVWSGAFVEENNLDKNISALRRALGEKKGERIYIETIRKHGYRFVAKVRRIEIEAESNNRPLEETNEPVKISDHHYKIERRGNVLAVADWQRDGSDQDAVETDPPPVDDVNAQSSATENKPPTLAVLPFKVINSSASEDYFGAGLADGLITNLSKTGDFIVRPTASVLIYSARDTSALQAGRDLRVEIIVDGTIKKIGGHLRINVQAINVADGNLLWAEKFEAAGAEFFRLEDEIAAFVHARLMKNPGAPRTPARLFERGTKSLAAYQAFLKARFYFHQGSPENYQKSNAFFREACELDPNFAEAYAGLANELVAETIFAMRDPRETSVEAEKAVRKALKFNPASAEAQAAFANFNLCFNFDLTAAERCAREAVRLNSSSADTFNLLGQALMFRRSFAESETALRRALELDPSGFWHLCALTVLYFLRGDYEQSIRHISETLRVNPQLFSESIKECWSLTELGKCGEALALYEKISMQDGAAALYVALFSGYTQAVTGDREKALSSSEQLKAMSERMYLSPYFLALIHAGLNDPEEAIKYLEQAFENRDPWAIWIAADPRLKNLRDDSRFQNMARRVVPEAPQEAKDNFKVAETEVYSPENFKTVGGRNEKDVESKSAEREIRSIFTPAFKAHQRYWIATLSIAALIGIGFVVYKFSSRSPEEPKSPASVEKPSVKPDLVYIPGGTFILGRDDAPPFGELKAPLEAPSRKIRVGSFWMDRTEVTNAEYFDFVRESGYPPPPHWINGKPLDGQERLPVVNVSLDDANAFAAWRSKRDRIAYRLPTEQEWERAARGVDPNNIYPWGSIWIEGRANLNSFMLKPVGSYPAGQSRWGVQDMIGNVWEWTSSRFSAYPGSDLKFVDTDNFFVNRGGSYRDGTQGKRAVTTTTRNAVKASMKHEQLGFRLITTDANPQPFSSGGENAALNKKQDRLNALSANAPYLRMSEAEQFTFIREKTRQIENLIEDAPTELSDDEIRAIKTEIDDYVEEIDSLSQKPFEEGLRVIYGRATQYVPIVRRAFEARHVPPVLGIYQAMVESEYHDCISLHENLKNAPVGLFQFQRAKAAKYGLTPKDYCDIEKQSDAAARLMSDLISDFDEKTLALLAFSRGENGVRDYLRQLRERNITERNAWIIRRNGHNLNPTLNEENESFYYAPKFFAAAIIGENPQFFDLTTPPLSTVR